MKHIADALATVLINRGWTGTFTGRGHGATLYRGTATLSIDDAGTQAAYIATPGGAVHRVPLLQFNNASEAVRIIIGE